MKSMISFVMVSLLVLAVKVTVCSSAALRAEGLPVDCAKNPLAAECKHVALTAQSDGSGCTPEQILEGDINCAHLREHQERRLAATTFAMISGDIFKSLLAAWAADNILSINPVSSLEVKAVASDDDLEILIRGGNVNRRWFQSQTIDMNFKGNVMNAANNVVLWKYEFTLTVNGQGDDELWLEGHVMHFYKTHPQDQLQGAILDFDKMYEEARNPNNRISTHAPHCKDHQQETTAPGFSGPKPDEHADCLDKAEMEIIKWDTILGASYEIEKFKIVIEASHNFTPRPTPSPTSAPPPAGMMGEPHIKTWDGRWYDYMGECDLVMLNAPNFAEGLGLTIHTRTTIRYWYSYIETAAVMLGEDILEVTGWGQYSLNGISQAEMPGTLSYYVVEYKQESENKHSFTIDIDGLATLSIDTFKDFVSVNMHHKNGAAVDAWLGNSIGLLGSYGKGNMLARDGISILGDPNAMGQEWQVRDSEPKLFMVDRSPQYPQKCNLPTEKDQKEKRRRLEASLSREDAERACAHWKDVDGCIYDVLATGDLELAEAGGYY